MKNKIKNFFKTVWDYIRLPFLVLSSRKTEKKLKRAAAEDKAEIFTEKDVEFLKSVGVETDLETLQNNCKK